MHEKRDIFLITNTTVTAGAIQKEVRVIKIDASGAFSLPLTCCLLFSGLLYADDKNTLPLPRDPAAAVREEYDMALRSNTPEAWRRFIARHKDDPLAKDALTRLKKVQGTSP